MESGLGPGFVSPGAPTAHRTNLPTSAAHLDQTCTWSLPPSTFGVLQVCSAPFQVERVGWGVFDAKVEIHLTDGKNVWCQHQLSLDGDGGSSLIPLGLDWSLQHRTQTPPATP